MKENKKTHAFIDSQNLNLAIKSIGWDLDFARFRVFLRDKYKVEKAFLFIGYVKENNTLYQKLESCGYEIVFKPTLSQKGTVKGNCDAELVLHCAKIEYDNYDKVIIVSGDGDFYCLIDFLIQENKLLAIAIPNKQKYSSLLRVFNKFCLFVSDFENKLKSKR